MALIGAVALALLVAVVVALAAGGGRPPAGCLKAIVPGPVGAEEVRECGPAARYLCANLGRSGYGTEARGIIAGECRRTRL